jgi:hypothetical protein
MSRRRVASALLTVLGGSIAIAPATAPARPAAEGDGVLWRSAPVTPGTLVLTAGGDDVAGGGEPVDEGRPRTYRKAPELPRNGDPAVILARLQRTIELLEEAIRMQQQPRTRDNVARTDAVLYAAYKYLGAANTGIELRIDRQIRGKKLPMKDPVLETALRTLEQVRGAHVRAAMNANQHADAAGTVQRAQQAIAVISQTMALVF